MKKAAARALLGKTFRSSADFELVLFDRLPEAEREMLSELQREPGFYGILRPVSGSGRTIKSVDRDTALLLMTLREPGVLPAYVVREEGDEIAARIAELVLDGILEVERDGGFVHGAEALEAMGGTPEEAPADGALARLSRAALRYAARLELDDGQRLAARLYSYHRLPVSPRWMRRLPDSGSVLDFVGAAAGGALASRLAARWSGPETRNPQWLSWSAHQRRAGPGEGPTYKLYVSPAVESLPTVMEIVAEPQLLRDAVSFKLGSSAPALLRPDKLVIYFARFEELAAASERLAERLQGMPVHGVPFTAEIANEGLLSWGLDPPGSEQLLSWRGPESWRLWVTNRLAVALLEGKRSSAADLPPWRFALERLRLEGVDVDRWVPSASLWRTASAERG